jgi:hypothetical protein
LASYRDLDYDGWGGNAVWRCESAPEPGYVLKWGDCCDLDARTHPGAATYLEGKDACGASDFNCDGKVQCEMSPCMSLAKFNEFICATSCL